MPGYTGTGMAVSLLQNRSVTVFANETVKVGEPSIAIHMMWAKGISETGGISVAVKFSGDPGACVISVEASDDDSPLDYVPINQVTNGNLTATFATRVDLSTPSAKFLRLNVLSIANTGVTVNATFARN